MSTVKTASDQADPAILGKLKPAPWIDKPLVENKRNFHWVTEKICGIVSGKPGLVVVVFHFSSLCR